MKLVPLQQVQEADPGAEVDQPNTVRRGEQNTTEKAGTEALKEEEKAQAQSLG